MNKERSPRFPSESLPDALARAERLYTAVGRSAVTSQVAASELGYSGLSGASRTALAVLSYYGIIQREGDAQRISDLGLRLIRPINADDKLAAARIATFRPSVFADIEKNHSDCNESALASILLHKGFTDDGARRAAGVYKENVAFIKSLEQSTSSDETAAQAKPEEKPHEAIELPQPRGKMLAQYQIPLGANHAQLIFTGEELVAEDFDALADYVALFKKQFQRKSGGATKLADKSVQPRKTKDSASEVLD